MKTLVAIIFFLALMVSSLNAYVHPFPDYQKQFEKSDLVAIVRVSAIKDTGATKRLEKNSRLEFREVEVQMKIISLFKGSNTNSFNCRIYRFPTKQERDADLGERDSLSAYVMANPWDSGIFVPKLHRDYLVYLKRSPDGTYHPVYESFTHTILELKSGAVTYPDEEAKRDGAANGKQSIHPQTNGTSSATSPNK